MLDYTTLKLIWWFLLGLLLIGFAIMDGFDLGGVALLPWIARNDIEKRMVINSIGPTWEGNQVWIILSGGAIFAAWPYLYAASFSGFYLAMFIVLTAFILRPVSFKYRGKMPGALWRNTWDTLLTMSGLIPALIFGLVVGNVLQGIPFHFDAFLRFYYTGSFWQLLNPFALLCSLVSVFMLCMHGAVYLANKTRDSIQQRCRKAAVICALITITFFALAGIWVKLGISGYALTQAMATGNSANPLHKAMMIIPGGWLNNYKQYPLAQYVPALGFVGAIATIIAVAWHKLKTAMVTSSAALAGIIATVGVSMFPVLLPSSENPSHSLLVWDASSSQLTLWLMLLTALVFFPIIIAYTAWVYRIMRGPVTAAMFDTKQSSKDLY